MPLSELHKRKMSKNLTVLAMIFGFCALVAAITMIKISANKESTANQETTLPVQMDTVEYP